MQAGAGFGHGSWGGCLHPATMAMVTWGRSWDQESEVWAIWGCGDPVLRGHGDPQNPVPMGLWGPPKAWSLWAMGTLTVSPSGAIGTPETSP